MKERIEDDRKELTRKIHTHCDDMEMCIGGAKDDLIRNHTIHCWESLKALEYAIKRMREECTK